MTSFSIGIGHHIKKERLNIKVEGLVVEKELGKQAQVLTVSLEYRKQAGYQENKRGKMQLTLATQKYALEGTLTHFSN